MKLLQFLKNILSNMKFFQALKEYTIRLFIHTIEFIGLIVYMALILLFTLGFFNTVFEGLQVLVKMLGR